MMRRIFSRSTGLVLVGALLLSWGVTGCVSAPGTTEEAAGPAQAGEAQPVDPAEEQARIAAENKAEEKRRKRRERSATMREAKVRAKERLKALEKKNGSKSRSREEGTESASRTARSATSGSLVIQKYEASLALPGTPEARKPEILARLAELALAEEEAALRQAYEDGTDMDILPGERYPRTVGYYRRLVDDYPESEQALTAFYNLGYLYSEEGEVELSARAYAEALKRDPGTKYAPEIHMRLGEARFSFGIYREAIKHYEKVVASDREKYRDKALYKLGWCYYNLDKYKTAVELFSKIVDQGDASPENLRDETLEVMGRAFMEWNGVAGVRAYLEGREPGKLYGDRLYQKLGDLYLKASRFQEAVDAYTTAIDTYPLSPLALEVERSTLTAYLTLRDHEAANNRRKSWAARYRPGTAWDAAHGAKLGVERDEMLEKGIRLAALYRHNRAQHGEGSLEAAIELYAIYDELFGVETEEGYEMAYAYAQALKEAQRHVDAAHRYNIVAELENYDTHREDASYRRVEELGILFASDPAWFDKYIEAHERYVQLNPKAGLVPEILFAIGELYFEAEKFDDARDGFGRVADGFPDHKLAPEAVERMARCNFRQDRFAEAERTARKTLDFHPTEETREQALKLVSFSIFKQAEAAQALAPAQVESQPPTAAPGKPAKPDTEAAPPSPTHEERAAAREVAVHHYFRLADEFSHSEAAQVSLYRAAENLRALGREKEAADVYQRLADQYEGSEFAESALSLSSEILSSMGDWKGVASNYEDLYALDTDGAQAADNLFRAARARDKAGQYVESEAHYSLFLELFPADHRRAQVFYRRSLTYQKLERAEEALEGYALAWASPAQGDEQLYRAKSALALGEKELELFRAVELKGDLVAALTLKEQHLEQALGYLIDTAGLSYAETLTAALFYAGEAFEQMKTAILESERPEGLDAEMMEEYEFLLEEKAFPLEEKAVDYYRRGIAAAREAKSHNEWVERMYARLETLLPWAFKRSEQAANAWVVPNYPFAGWEVHP